MKYLMVPVKDIENVEEARMAIHGLMGLDEDAKIARFINDATSKIYKLTHKKYRVIEE